MPDSDWGEDSDSGSIHEPDHYPASTLPNNLEYDVELVDIPINEDEWFAPGTTPFIVDQGSSKIFLGPEGSMHAQILADINGLVGPIERGYINRSNGEIKMDFGNPSPARLESIERALSPYLPKPGRFGQKMEPTDLQECRHCNELKSNCKCLSWSDDADWATDPIDQSGIRELKPGIQSSLTIVQKASAWDKPRSELTPSELAYVNRRASGEAHRRIARTCRCPRCAIAQET